MDAPCSSGDFGILSGELDQTVGASVCTADTKVRGVLLMENYIKFETVSLKNHPEINEKWVQQKIETDPSILGLGDLSVRQSEKIQQSGGRVDLLLQDDDSNTRYTVELQLGKTDETHIIRTIEYWDNERKRNQNYNYVAVIIAEDITNRFFNVISLFNGSIPIIAIQLKAIKYQNDLGLDFTTVLGLITPDEEEEVGETVDRAYWESRATKDTVKIADKLLDYIEEFVNGFTLKYNRYYIGLVQNGTTKNFVSFRPKKSMLKLSVKLKKAEDIDEIINNSDLDALSYNKRYNQYQFRLKEEDLKDSKGIIVDLLKRAYEDYTGVKIEEN